MDDEKLQRRSVFYPLTMVTAWSFTGAVLLCLGALQLFMMPQGHGMPLDDAYWHPLIPYGIIAVVALVAAGIFWGLKTVRDVFLSASIVVGGGTLGFGMMMFALAERASIDEFVQAKPLEPENSYTCRRQTDGSVACLNELGESDPNFTSTIVRPQKTQP